MRFQGDIAHNLKNAIMANDDTLARELIADELVSIIESNPKEVINALEHSKVNIDEDASKEDLIDIVAYNIVNNPIFRKNTAVLFTMKGSNRTPNEEDYASQSGSSGSGGSGSGGGGATAGLVGSLADMIGSAFKFGSSSKELKAQEESTKATMYAKLFGENKKTNWMPIVVIGGVLLIGALVIWRVTANKN